MFAGIPACLRSVCAVICLRMFTHVYATFTQCLRNVYAMFTQICFCLHNAVICVNIATFFTCLRMFTHVYACLRMFTQTLRKRNYVYAVFTHVYACLRRLRTGQLADVENGLQCQFGRHGLDKISCGLHARILPDQMNTAKM
jgi:hypothetical protein